MELRDPNTGRYITQPAFYPPSDPRHSTRLAASIKGRMLLHHYRPHQFVTRNPDDEKAARAHAVLIEEDQTCTSAILRPASFLP